jgi:hypothetical protein
MKNLPIMVAVAAIPALFVAGFVGAQSLVTTDPTVSINGGSSSNGLTIQRIITGSDNTPLYVETTSSNGTRILTPYPTAAQGAPSAALFHQVVDTWFDANGNPVKTASSTHTVDAYCQGGRRLPPDLVAQDDGKGNVRFAPLLLASEPTTGVKPVTAEGRVKAIMATRSTPAVAEPAVDPSKLAAR